MFFIAGIKDRRSTVDTGSFRCPNEGGERRYEHVRIRRWVTLFFIPLIPLGSKGEHVRCQSCGTVYPPSTLQAHSSR